MIRSSLWTFIKMRLCSKSSSKGKGELRPNEAIFRQEFEKVIRDGLNSSAKKGKRYRSAFTTEQVTYLEKEFRKYPYVGNSRRKDIASVLGIPERAVKIWFQNRRMKQKKDIQNKEPEAGVKTVNELKVQIEDKNQGSGSLLSPESEKSIHTAKVLSNVTVSDSKPKAVVAATQSTVNSLFSEGNQLNITPSTINANSAVTSAAQYSVQLLKKYETSKSETTAKEMFSIHIEPQQSNTSRYANQSNVNNESQIRYSPYPTTAVPEDLSSYMKRTTNTKHDRSKPKLEDKANIFNNNNANDSMYLKGFYSQPFIPPGNMIWKPIHVAPVMSTGMSTMIPNNAPLVAQDNVSRGCCNCNCHVKSYATPIILQPNNPTPQLQYVFTVPFQNNLPKF